MRTLAALSTAFLLVSTGASWHAHPLSPCLPADSSSADVIDDIADIVTGTSHSDSVSRAQLYLPSVAANQVTLVTTDSICYAAILGLDRTDSTTQAYVLRVGSSAYVVRFPPSGGGTVYFYTEDSTFTFKAISTF
jgi:hypothetical protein